MALSNSRVAWVNRSNTNIPVYSSLVSSSIHTGGSTAGGTKVGVIYPGEFYTLVPNSSHYLTSYQIIFRDGNGAQRTGYIESSPGYTLGYHAWVSSQEPYHYYNSNGSSLVSAARVSISGKSYYVFTVNKSVSYRNPSGVVQGRLASGTKLATDCSTTGQTYGGYMLFQKKKTGSTWTDLVSGSGYGFVDLGLAIGSMPNDRAIR